MVVDVIGEDEITVSMSCEGNELVQLYKLSGNIFIGRPASSPKVQHVAKGTSA